MPTNLLLVDTVVRGYQKIAGAVNADTRAVLFSSLEDSYDSLKAKIAAAGVSRFDAVGIVQHGSDIVGYYQLLETATPAIVDNVDAVDPSLASWADFAGFLKGLKADYGVSIVDFISCRIYSNPGWVYVLNELEKQTDLNLRASADDTGNLANGGNWVQESDNVNIEGLYFTEAIRAFTGLLYAVFRWSSGAMVSAQNPVNNSIGVTGNFKRIDKFYGYPNSIYITAPTGITGGGALSTWGASQYGGASSGETGIINTITAPNPAYGGITGGVITVITNGFNGAFAALKSDGSVVTWGYGYEGGASSGETTFGSTITTPNNGGISGGVIAITSTDYAFAALKSDGSVSTWGAADAGGASSGETGYAGLVNTTPNNGGITGGVIAIAATTYAFAALKSDGSVSTWGYSQYGGASSGETGIMDASTVPNNGGITGGVVAIAASRFAFAALKADGSVSTWGSITDGGASSGETGPTGTISTTPNNGGITGGVIAIAATNAAFAAIKQNGSVSTWGARVFGGESSGNPVSGVSTIPNNGGITGGVTAICSNARAFAALKSNGAVSTWGSVFFGGESNGNPVGGISTTPNNGGITGGVVAICSSQRAFAALKSNGAVSTWGSNIYGGKSDSTPIANINTTPDNGGITGGVVAITAGIYSFAALKSNGAVSSWGSINLGGGGVGQTGADIISKPTGLTGGVISISSAGIAYSALRSNGSVVTWGASEGGGASSGETGFTNYEDTITVPNNGGITGNIKAIFSNSIAFTALHKTPQFIVFPPLSSGQVGQAPVDPGATSSGGLPIIYTSSNPAVAKIVNGKIVFIGAGTAVITASQGGDFNYEPAVSVFQVLTVTGGTRAVVGAMSSAEWIRLQRGKALVRGKSTCVLGACSEDLLVKATSAPEVRVDGKIVKKSCCERLE
jgi:alpha-tubulin suppressor-like RCC1 family protein